MCFVLNKTGDTLYIVESIFRVFSQEVLWSIEIEEITEKSIGFSLYKQERKAFLVVIKAIFYVYGLPLP